MSIRSSRSPSLARHCFSASSLSRRRSRCTLVTVGHNLWQVVVHEVVMTNEKVNPPVSVMGVAGAGEVGGVSG